MAERMVIGIPAFDERESLPETLACLDRQTDRDFEVWVLVNQPRSYGHDPTFAAVDAANRETLEWLERQRGSFGFPLRVLDAVDPRSAPEDGEAGVGWARKQLFDKVVAEGEAWCLSLDADTQVDTDYVAVARAAFRAYPNGLGLVFPYFHPLPSDPQQALLLLRYECYMRYYQLHLWRIGSPYSFLALGSAFGFRSEAYRRVGGIPPRKAGEDFYFLQQLRKAGPLIWATRTCVRPAARISSRVPFGTGPVLKEALSWQRQRYPFYPKAAFDILAESFALFPKLYREDVPLPLAPYLPKALLGNVFPKWRRVFPSEAHFLRACHERFDGLRCLQVLKAQWASSATQTPEAEAETLKELLVSLGEPPVFPGFIQKEIATLDAVRTKLYQHECQQQVRAMREWDPSRVW